MVLQVILSNDISPTSERTMNISQLLYFISIAYNVHSIEYETMCSHLTLDEAQFSNSSGV